MIYFTVIVSYIYTLIAATPHRSDETVDSPYSVSYTDFYCASDIYSDSYTDSYSDSYSDSD